MRSLVTVPLYNIVPNRNSPCGRGCNRLNGDRATDNFGKLKDKKRRVNGGGPSAPTPDPCIEFTIVSRSGWNAMTPRSTTAMPTPALHVYTHHTDTPSCFSSTSCESRVRSIQNHHMNTNGWYTLCPLSANHATFELVTCHVANCSTWTLPLSQFWILSLRQ